MKHIAIFGSGGGSNARSIIEYFRNDQTVKVALIVSNRSEVGILEHAAEFEIPTKILDRDKFYNTDDLLSDLSEHKVDLIVLAGFLWLIPKYLIKAYPDQIVNIHPALLPKFGGKGMYGMNVHRAVKEAREQESGITIHTIDEEYDRGRILFQAKCKLNGDETPEEIAAKVLRLEHDNYARIIAEHLE